MPEPLPPNLPVTEDLLTAAHEPGQASTYAHAGESVSTDQSQRDCSTHPHEPVELPPGFEYLRTLGRGGMGIVHGARQTALKRDVAIKMILADRGASESQIARFRSEVEAVARFQHPNIVQIFEVGEIRGTPFCVLEYVEGGTLGRYLDRKPIPPAEAARIAESLARAVHYAHQRQILHRDLKPGNILLTSDREPKVADFGLAKHLDDDTGQTQDGQVVGTPKYMAPEQARGDQRSLGPQTDVYSLGVILYEMLTGDVPFAGSTTIEVLNKVMNEEPIPPRQKQPRLPADLETICLKCLRKLPADRYTSALMLAQDLERYRSGEPILARPEGVLRRGVRLLRRRRVAALTVAVLLAASFAFYFATGSRKQQRINDVGAEIQDATESAEWSPEKADEVEAMLATLEGLAPERVSMLRARAHDRYRQSIIAELARPRLSDSDWLAIEDKSRDLIRRNASCAPDLQSRMKERRSEAVRILDLEPPFAGHESIFVTPDWLEVIGAELRRKAAGDPLLATKVSAVGSLKIEAHFENWQVASRVGIRIGGPNQPAYQFLLCSQLPNGALADASLDVARKQSGLSLVVMRDRIELQRKSIALEEKTAILRATRDGDRLTFQLNDSPPLECYDPFPLPDGGTVEFVWPKDVAVTRLIGTRQSAPRTANPLERGNGLFLQGNYEDALRFFQQFRSAATEPQAKAEAKYKVSVCLARLGRFDEARKLLEADDDVPAGRWSALALYQLWMIHTEQSNLAKGAEVFRLLKVQYPPEELLHVIPSTELLAVWSKYDIPPTDLIIDEHPVERTRTLVDIGDLLLRLETLSLSNWSRTVQLLDRAYQLEGKPDKALEVLVDSLSAIERRPDSSDKLVAHSNLLEDYLWLLGTNGSRTFALAEIERYLPPASDQSQSAYRLRISLSLSKCRLLASEKRWPEAERAIEATWELLRHPVVEAHRQQGRNGNYYHHSTLNLMRGLIREELGDAAGADQYFRAGTRSAYLESIPPEERGWRTGFDSNTIRDNLYLATRTGSLTDAAATDERERIVSIFAGSKGIGGMANLIPLPPEALRKMWLLPSSRDLMRKIAFHEIGYAEYTWGPIKQLVVALVHVEAVTDLTPAHERLLRALADRFVELARTRKLGRTSIMMLGYAWVAGPGALGTLGWQGVKPTLPKDVLGPISCLLGYRYLKLDRPKDAIGLFQAALEQDGENSEVGKLAKKELDRLREPKK